MPKGSGRRRRREAEAIVGLFTNNIDRRVQIKMVVEQLNLLSTKDIETRIILGGASISDEKLSKVGSYLTNEEIRALAKNVVEYRFQQRQWVVTKWRYWITTVISVVALAIGLIALLKPISPIIPTKLNPKDDSLRLEKSARVADQVSSKIDKEKEPNLSGVRVTPKALQ